MSSVKYARIKTPSGIEESQLPGFKKSFTEAFRAIGGKHGAKVRAVTADIFNKGATPLLTATIAGKMNRAQQKYIAAFR